MTNPMPDTTLTSAELAEALANLTDAFLLRHGCFPLDRTTPAEKVINDAMSEAYRLIGQPATPERDRKLSLARAGLEAGKADESMAARDVLAERKRQVEAEGWTPEHDDKHAKGEMAKAAASYAVDNVSLYPPGQWNSERRSIADWLWPWDMRWWKPTNRRRNLVKAGALILAEIERLDRTAIRALPITGGDKP